MQFPKVTFGTPQSTPTNLDTTPVEISYEQVFSDLVQGRRYKIILFAYNPSELDGDDSHTVQFSRGRNNAFQQPHLKSQPAVLQNYNDFFEYEFVADEPQMKVTYTSNDSYSDAGDVINVVVNAMLIDELRQGVP